MKQFFLMVCIAICLPAMGQNTAENSKEPQKFRISVNGGYGLRLASLSDDIPTDLRDYTRKLKSGFSIGMDAAYLVGDDWGLGLKYSRFTSYGSLGNMQVTYPDGSSAIGSISDNIKIDYVAPNFLYEMQLFNPKHMVMTRFGVGYLAYRDDSLIVDRIIDYKGSTVGYNEDFGYEYALSKRLSLAAQCSIIAGVLSKIEITEENTTSTIELDEGNREGLGRLDLVAAIKFTI